MIPNQDVASPIELPQHMAHAPSICRYIELYPSDERTSAPLARFILARNELADASLQSQRFACRYLTQKILSSSFAAPADAWTLDYSASGAPRLSIEGKPSALNISMAHSSQWLAVGLSSGARIGVDVEQLRQRDDIFALAKYLDWKDRVSDLCDFYAKWTLWEASAKCVHGSALMRRNAGFKAMAGCRGQVRNSGLWNGLQDVFSDDVFFAIVLKCRRNRCLSHHNLDAKRVERWRLANDPRVKSSCG